MKNYNYEWKSLKDILENKNILINFRGYGESSLDKITNGATNNVDCQH